MKEKDFARFADKLLIDEETGCWMFIFGCQDDEGYGQFWLGKRVIAHRASYEHFHGPIPDERELDHKKCRLRCCTNPAHLEPVTKEENLKRRGWQRLTRARVRTRKRTKHLLPA